VLFYVSSTIDASLL